MASLAQSLSSSSIKGKTFQQVSASLSKKPKNQKTKRILKEKESKVFENVKRLLVLKGPKTSEVIKHAMADFYKLKHPNALILTKRNQTRPFEDRTSVEFLGQKNDCSLFIYGSHSKKRPHNLVLGRQFNFEVLDMFEFGIEEKTFKTMDDLSHGRQGIARLNSKPAFIFQGEEFDSNPDFVTLKSLLLDAFRGTVMTKINLAALDRVFIVSVVDGIVYFRHYCILMKKSGTKFPRIELEECGPRMDLTLRRRYAASETLRAHAMKVPAAARPKIGKNKSLNTMEDTLGRVYMEPQDLDTMALARLKGLNKRKRSQKEDNSSTQEQPPLKKQELEAADI